MIRKVFILSILVCSTVSDEVLRECVRYTFEGYSDESLTNELGCQPGPLWVTGKYSDLTSTIDAPERSTTFIKPQPLSTAGSCVSFILTMHGGGKIEVNLYMNNTALSDGIVVMAVQLNGKLLNVNAWNPAIQDFFSGWHTLDMSLPGADKDTYKGYISIMGMNSPNSTVLVDSFRYIPPGMDASECQLYEDLPGVDDD